MIEKTQIHKPNETPILFVNFRDEEFTGQWDSKEFKFAPKETRWLPFWLAVHFAKHLVNDEMNARKIRTDDPSRESFVAKCIGNEPEKKNEDDPLGIEILNRNMESEKKKVGRPKKETKTEEETFEGLEK